MSVLDRSLSAIKDVLLLRDQFKAMREELGRMGGNIAGMPSDIREPADHSLNMTQRYIISSW